MLYLKYSTHLIIWCTRFDICSSGKVKSGEEYPNRVTRFGLNRAYMKIRLPNSCCQDKPKFFLAFYGHLRFVVWLIVDPSKEYIKVIIVYPKVHFFFLCTCNISRYLFSYLYVKQIKSNFGNMFYLWMIFICVNLNQRDLPECRTMNLNPSYIGSTYSMYYLAYPAVISLFGHTYICTFNL